MSLRLDPDLVARLRGLGPGWQTLAAEALSQLVAGKAATPIAKEQPTAERPRKAS